jgi:hypothetical protein
MTPAPPVVPLQAPASYFPVSSPPPQETSEVPVHEAEPLAQEPPQPTQEQQQVEQRTSPTWAEEVDDEQTFQQQQHKNESNTLEETSPSTGASPNEDGGLWTLLVQLKERILASGRRMGPVILNVFQKFKNAIWHGCVSVYGIVYDICCLLCYCTVVLVVSLYLCLYILGLIPWTICAIVYGRLTGVNLVSFTVTRSTNKSSKRK